MYIRIHETKNELTISVDLSRISRDTANAAELAALMAAVNDLEWAAQALGAYIAARIAPF